MNNNSGMHLGLGVRIGMVARRGFGRLAPDPFVLAVALTILTFGVSVAYILFRSSDSEVVSTFVLGANPIPTGWQQIRELLRSWSGSSGLWKLATFAMQISVMLVLGTAVAQATVIQSGLSQFIVFVRNPRQLVASVAAWSIGLALINWSLGLIAGAFMAREAGRLAQRRGWTLHYPLLCAAGYSGLMVWHGGWSGTAPLKVTQLSDLQEILGTDLASRVGAISLSKTLLGPLNLFVSFGLFILGPWLFYVMTPKPGQDPGAYEFNASSSPLTPNSSGKTDQGNDELEESPWILRILGLLFIAALSDDLLDHGLENFGLNQINLCLWCAALFAHSRPSKFIQACESGIRGCTGVIIQFPLYAGIMILLSQSGLSQEITALVGVVGPTALAIWTFFSAAILNLLIPSGGGQWAVQGPVIMQAALDVGARVEYMVMAMAYGDQLTNMLQPFWALPLLAITGVQAREIAGYCAIWMVFGGLWVLLGLLVFV